MSDEWVCEICGQKFKVEVDLLAHQFNSQCESDLKEREDAQPQDNGKGGDK